MMVIGESRSELLQWLNSTFALEYTKVEQCGTGAAYCQIMDLIYGGVAMNKVKFGPNTSEYDARNNMKVLQAAFNRHKITRHVDTERLIKCRLQDNLELLQWLKRHWMENKDANVAYDAAARRRGTPQPPPGERAGAGLSRRTTAGPGSGNLTPRAASRVSSRVISAGSSFGNGSTALSVPKQRVTLAGSNSKSDLSNQRVLSADVSRDLAEKSRALDRANEENAECKLMMETLETERNFYYNKLREIEVLSRRMQDLHDQEDVAQLSVLDVMAEIQKVLYSTEKGFEIQDNTDAESF